MARMLYLALELFQATVFGPYEICKDNVWPDIGGLRRLFFLKIPYCNCLIAVTNFRIILLNEASRMVTRAL